MNTFHFLSLHLLFLLWTLPMIVLFYVFESNRRRRALQSFADVAIVSRLTDTVDRSRGRWKMVLTILAYTLIVIALARPAWNPQPQKVVRKGRDVVFVLDVSRSMLAEDLSPNRLERAKLSIIDTIDRLQGDRVGLVAFAGTSAVKCPLTLDYGFFRSMVDRLSANSITRGGTLIGDAIRRTIDEVFDDQDKQFKDIVLITDGEDHESFPAEAAAAAGERGIRIIAIGIGDEDTGSRIPVTDETGSRTFLQYQGQEVWSKLDADTLREMANATPGGRYINVSTSDIDLGDIYLKLVASAEKKALESETLLKYEEKFQLFLVIAFVALLAEIATSRRRRRGASDA